MNEIIKAKMDAIQKLADATANDPFYVPREIPVSTKNEALTKVITTEQDAEAFLIQIEALSSVAASGK
ncbi:hypothetical protein HHL16_08760 [Pseudoflavitalea sp. G-6-1-2]|uniref:hypothetical protein n=1 Tax=Pseudoflavitalea sp. G-6-1-2 TaxID=2728841 RepID=UPI00146B65B4|nr:hypothetical protein [Pseudoflavitalea sp. G-6-1-2]NML20962.1 hypothetical protein [Pseudoflavitalea sp. G-6-1-2]